MARWFDMRAVMGCGMARMLASLLAVTAASAATPSIVLILTDDEDLASHRVMAKTKALVADQGAVFANYFVTYAFCCPSRDHDPARPVPAQPPHRGQRSGRPAASRSSGRWASASSTIATWLHGAGYRTALSRQADERLRARAARALPGWDEWYGVGGRFTNFDYTLNENGRLVALRQPARGPSDRRARAQGRRRDPRARPPTSRLFLYVAPYDPHSPATPAPRHAELYADEPLPASPVVRRGRRQRQAVLRRRPAAAGGLAEGGARPGTTASGCARCGRSTTWSATVVEALEETGRLDNTYVVYTSDNGFHMGQHRLFIGKTTAYEEDIRVPLAIRGPGVPEGARGRADGR